MSNNFSCSPRGGKSSQLLYRQKYTRWDINFVYVSMCGVGVCDVYTILVPIDRCCNRKLVERLIANCITLSGYMLLYNFIGCSQSGVCVSVYVCVCVDKVGKRLFQYLSQSRTVFRTILKCQASCSNTDQEVIDLWTDCAEGKI